MTTETTAMMIINHVRARPTGTYDKKMSSHGVFSNSRNNAYKSLVIIATVMKTLTIGKHLDNCINYDSNIVLILS